MNKIKRIFFEQNISWLKLIIFSIICGIITGIIPLIKILNNTSIHNISVCFEAWVFLAMFIILNSKGAVEAGVKTFVFFLISQPLCYLVQVPFYVDGFAIFKYYPYWAFLTILTLPGAMIAWYTKKENWISVLILSVANLLLSFEIIEHFQTLIKSFPNQLFAVIFIIFEIILFIRIIFKERNKRIFSYIICISLLSLAIFNILYRNISSNTEYASLYSLEPNINYTIIEHDEIIDVKISDGIVIAKSKKLGNFKIKIEDDEGNYINLLFSVSDKNVELQVLDTDTKNIN